MRNYYAATRSKTKAGGTQSPKVHGVDKAVNPSLKPETQVKREGVPKPISVIPELVSQLKGIIPSSLPRKGQRKSSRCYKEIDSIKGYKLILQPQPKKTTPLKVLPQVRSFNYNTI